jgi:uncharacterized protein (TIGR03437 family)
VAPFFADDNREATISDDGNTIAFISTRNLVPAVGNADGNPELFFFNRTTSSFVQATNTRDTIQGVGLVFQQNPSLSADGSVVAFVSSANLTGSNNDNNGSGNAEVFVANFSGSAVSNVRQITRTKDDATHGVVNFFGFGRRLSRDGTTLAFESLANDPKADNTTTNTAFFAPFVYTIATDTFVQIGQRAASAPGDIIHFPTFTDYDTSTLAPRTLVFASALNFRPDGSFPAVAQDAEGLNPQRSPQLFATSLPASSSSTFVRLTNIPTVTTFGSVRPVTSESRKRLSFSIGGVELGGGNADLSIEVYYLLSPQVTVESAGALSFFTGASNMPVAAATPLPSPTPSPTPTPSPVPGAPAGLAPGELNIVRSTVDLAPSNATSPGGSETKRSPALPVELNGVSLAVNGAAAGLYFVGNSPKQINFVMPVGASGLGNVVVNVLNSGNNSDTILRGLVQVVPFQPDIFSTTSDAGGQAIATNITNPNIRTGEPFNVTSTDQNGNTVPTVIELTLTGARTVATSEVTITIGTTAITGDSILFVGPNKEMPGFDIINFTLPASLAGAGNPTIVVTVTRTISVTSRPDTTAPHIQIN